jgi:hypothetical protein
MTTDFANSRKLFFFLPDVAKLVREVTSVDPLLGTTDSWLDTEEGRTTGPALMWVKDDGTYLMTNVKRAEGETPTIVRGRADTVHGPVLDGDQWDLTREICGGDDFAEYLPLEDENGLGKAILAATEARAAQWLEIDVEQVGYGEVGSFAISLY